MQHAILFCFFPHLIQVSANLCKFRFCRREKHHDKCPNGLRPSLCREKRNLFLPPLQWRGQLRVCGGAFDLFDSWLRLANYNDELSFLPDNSKVNMVAASSNYFSNGSLKTSVFRQKITSGTLDQVGEKMVLFRTKASFHTLQNQDHARDYMTNF